MRKQMLKAITKRETGLGAVVEIAAPGYERMQQRTVTPLIFASNFYAIFDITHAAAHISERATNHCSAVLGPLKQYFSIRIHSN
jgi:hypothetical protein